MLHVSSADELSQMADEYFAEEFAACRLSEPYTITSASNPFFMGHFSYSSYFGYIALPHTRGFHGKSRLLGAIRPEQR